MNDLRVFYYRFITSIDFDKNHIGEFSLKDYIKIQHRWFHETYKKMNDNAATNEEIKNRLNELENFIYREEWIFNKTFNDRNRWLQATFKETQLSKIDTIFN